jgi:cephalosporin hydroxylase
MYKLPFDAIVIQEIIAETLPDLIIETGTAKGGSALFYASIMEMLGTLGTVVTIDIISEIPEDVLKARACSRIKFIEGSSITPRVVEQVRQLASGKKCMVILDSWHSYDHVCKELELYAPFVSKGCYLIVEDSHVSGHPVEWSYGPGPFEAIWDFLKLNSEFQIDFRREKHLMTFNPCGYLLRWKDPHVL